MGPYLPAWLRAEKKLVKITTAEQIPREPKHFLRERLPEGGAGLTFQRGLEGQDSVAERQVKPTGFVCFQEHQESSELPSYSPMGFSAGECEQALGEGGAEGRGL